jgi:hypothetical protein
MDFPLGIKTIEGLWLTRTSAPHRILFLITERSLTLHRRYTHFSAGKNTYSHSQLPFYGIILVSRFITLLLLISDDQCKSHMVHTHEPNNIYYTGGITGPPRSWGI